jgi:hypothetical protein
MLMPYGAKGAKQVNELLLMHCFFDSAVAEYAKGRTFAESSG